MAATKTQRPIHKRPRERELWDLYLKQRMSHRELQAHYGVGASTISRWLTHYGLGEQRNAMKRGEIEQRDRAARHEAGREKMRGPRERHVLVDEDAFRENAKTMTIAEMSKHYDVDRSTVSRRLKGLGITAPDGRRPSHPPRDELEALRDDGMTLAAIGERYGVSRQRVHQWCHPKSA